METIIKVTIWNNETSLIKIDDDTVIEIQKIGDEKNVQIVENAEARLKELKELAEMLGINLK